MYRLTVESSGILGKILKKNFKLVFCVIMYLSVMYMILRFNIFWFLQAYLEFFTSEEIGMCLHEVLQDYPTVHYRTVNFSES